MHGNSSLFVYYRGRIAIRQRRLCSLGIYGVLVYCMVPSWDFSVKWLYAECETLGDVHETCSRSVGNTPLDELVEVSARLNFEGGDR